MAFYLLPFICLGLYATIKYLLIPALERQQPVSVSKRILKEVTVSSAHTLNSLVLTAAILYAVLGLLFVVLRLSAGSGSADFVRGLLGFFSSINAWIDPFNEQPYIKFLGLGVLLVALSAALYRSYRSQYTRQFDQKAAELAKDFASGKVPYQTIPPTPDMTVIQENIQVCEDRIRALTKEYKKKPSSELAGEIKKTEELLGVYSQVWYQFDISRRVKLDNVTPDKTSLKDDILLFLSSRGLIDTVNGLTGTLTKIALICTLTSLITVQTLQGSRVITDQLTEFYLTKKLDETRSAFEKTVRENAAPRTISEGDERALDEMAADYELLFANSLFKKSDSTTFLMHSLVVRQQILDAFVKMAANRSNSPDFGTQPSLADSSFYDTSTPEGQTAWRSIQTYTRIQTGTTYSARQTQTQRPRLGSPEQVYWRRPKTAVGAAFKARMRDEFASQSEALWTKLKSRWKAYKASFHKPIPLNDLQGMFFAEVVGKFAETKVVRTGDATFDKLGNDLFSDTRGDLIVKANEQITYEFMSKLTRDEPYENVIQYFSKLTPDETFGSSYQAAAIRSKIPTLPPGSANAIAGHHPPSLKANVKPIDLTAAKEALTNLSGGTLDERATVALNSYEDFFPGQINSESSTAAGRLRRSLAPAEEATERLLLASADANVPTGGIGGFGGSSKSRSSFVRSRSYARLRGFSRIGGVLIGNDAENRTASAQKTGADFVDLTWKENGNNLTLTLRNRDGSQVQVGTYSKAIVQQALAYAADGRPTTVTMVTVPPIAQLKVLLHPALVNSQLGKTAMSLDRLVDSFQSPDIEMARERVMLWGVLYGTAYMERTLSRFSGQSFADNEQQQIERLRESQQAKWKELEKYWPQLRSVMPKDHPDQYPFQAKAAHFDMALLRLIQQTIKSSADFATFKDNLLAAFGTDYEPGRASFPTEFQVWSGVREQPYRIDKTLSFLRNNTASRYYPLDFMVQVAFTSTTKPESGDSETQEETPDDDESPWQFPALSKRNAVNLAVMRGIDQHPEYDQVLRDMQQFTQLQRVFRLAFRGELGYDFPLDQLLDLLYATNGSVPRVETPDWNRNPNAMMTDLLSSSKNENFAKLTRALGVYRREDEN